MKVIGIDMGTSTISGVVADSISGAVLAVRNIPNKSTVSTPNGWERIQDGDKACQAAKAVLDQLLTRCPDVQRIGLTGQMHGILYVNAEGEAASPLYTWQDGRGDLPEFGGRPLTALIREKTGLFVPSGYGLVTHLYQVKRNLVPKDGRFICTVSDYLGMKLTGRREPMLHASNGASLGFFDAKDRCFQADAAEKAGIDLRILPKIKDETECLGKYRGIPVYAAIGDNQASFLGAAGGRENTVLLNMGTGGQISLLSSEYLEIPGIETRPFVDRRYLLVGASLCGGKAYALLESFFRSYLAAAGADAPSQYPVMERLARAGWQRELRKNQGSRLGSGKGLGLSTREGLDSGKGLEEGLSLKEYSQGQRDWPDQIKTVTAFAGTRLDPKARGSITGIGVGNFTPEDVICGVLKGMVEELMEMYRQIRERTGISADKLILSGNGFRKNPVLQDMASHTFGLKASLAAGEEEAACGCAFGVAAAEEG